MRNKIMLIVFIIVLSLFLIIILNGLSIGKIQFFSIKQLNEKNQNLNNKVQNIEKLSSIDYPSKVDTMEETYNKLKVQKQKYEGMTEIQNTSEQIHEIKQYDVEYLWKVIGKYSTSRKIGINMAIEKGSSSDLYNLKFNINGTYSNIIQFITDLEGDSDLQFSIYDFTMSATNSGASFLKSSTQQDEKSNVGTEEKKEESNNEKTEETGETVKEDNNISNSGNKNTTNTTTNNSSSDGILYSTFNVKNVKINSSSITTK